MKTKITIELLDNADKGAIIASGIALDAEGHLHLARTGKMTPWVAVRGEGAPDWAIYAQNPHYIDKPKEIDFAEVEYEEIHSYILQCGMSGIWSNDRIARIGDKVSDPINIKYLVDCTPEALKRYRY
jgi:hypothetical protein